MAESEPVYLLIVAPRPDGAFTVSVTNNGPSRMKAQLKVFGFDKETLSDKEAPNGEPHQLRWGKLDAKLVFLEPGESRKSNPIRVPANRTHVVVAGQGQEVQHCEVSVDPVPSPAA